MNISRHIYLALLCAFALTLSACGGGGTFGGGIGGTGLVIGPITDFGSIIVEGIEFDTSSAIVSVDGTIATPSDLALGMIVTVTGEVDSDGIFGVADAVSFESVLEGPVTAVDVASRTATVLGQTVRVSPDTVFSGVVIDASLIGRQIRVSGFVDADGGIRATRIGGRPAGGKLVFTGQIRQVDAQAKTFVVRGLTIDFTAATVDAIPAGGLRDGLIARVTVIAGPTLNSVRAVRVSFREPEVDQALNVEVRLAGFIRSILSSSEFVLGDLAPVRTTDTTTFVGGTAADLARNVKVAVVGRVTRSRVVVARRVVFL